MIEFEQQRSFLGAYIYHQTNINLQAGPHFHSTFEFIFVYSGSIKVHINNATYLLQSNTACLILPSEIHWYEQLEGSSSFLSIFSPDYVADFFDFMENRQLTEPCFQMTDIQFLEEYAQSKNPFFIKSFLYYLISKATEKGIKEKETLIDPLLMHRFQNYVAINYKEDISMKNMAKDLNYNYTYLSNFFNKNFLTGFSKFINEYRITLAKKLIVFSSLSMAQISIECGFSSIRNFNRAFYEIEKCTPTQYKVNVV